MTEGKKKLLIELSKEWFKEADFKIAHFLSRDEYTSHLKEELSKKKVDHWKRKSPPKKAANHLYPFRF
jgi:hypothetical protein